MHGTLSVNTVTLKIRGANFAQPVSGHPHCQSDQLQLNPLENENFFKMAFQYLQISEFLTALQTNVSTRSFNVSLTSLQAAQIIFTSSLFLDSDDSAVDFK